MQVELNIKNIEEFILSDNFRNFLMSNTVILKDVRYKRNSTDFKNELFVHTFNGSEKFYTCNLKNNLVYYVLGYKDLWEREIHK